MNAGRRDGATIDNDDYGTANVEDHESFAAILSSRRQLLTGSYFPPPLLLSLVVPIFKPFIIYFCTHTQTEHDFNLEKQTLVHEAKLAVQDEFAKKEKDREIQERISRSAEIGLCRQKKMTLRDDLLNSLMREASSKCKVVADGNNYPALLQKLIVQGLIKIEELEVVVYCRKEDVATVTKVIPAAVKEYVDIMQRESGIKLAPKVEVNADRKLDLADSSNGGVKLTALGGKIVCDNTMSSRLALVYEELMPSIREILFPEQ